MKQRDPTATSIKAETSVSIPPGAPQWVTAELIEQTIRVWQRFYTDPLTADDALGIILNVTGLVETLSQGRHHEAVCRFGTREQSRTGA